MSTQKIIKIKKAITLPKEVRSQWKNQIAALNIVGDTIIIKRVGPPSWNELLPKLRKAGKQISRKTLKDAIVWARKK